MVNLRGQTAMHPSVLAVLVLCLALPLHAQNAGDQASISQQQTPGPQAASAAAIAAIQPAAEQAGQKEPDTDEISAVPNRPTFSTTALTVQRGVLEVEYGFEGGQGHQNMNGLVKFGLFKSLELRFANNPIERDTGIAGSGDSSAGFKWKFLSQRNARPDIAVLYTATIPTAANQLGAGATGHAVQALVSKDFGKEHFDANEGVQFVGRSAPGTGGFDRSYFSALSWSRAISGKWGVSAELAGFSRTNSQTPATMTILGTPTYNLSPRLVLDTGAYVRVYGNLPRVTFFCGVTYSIGDFYRSHRLRMSTEIRQAPDADSVLLGGRKNLQEVSLHGSE